MAGLTSESITIFFFEFRKVMLAIPEIDVRASVGEGSAGMADGFAVTFKKEYPLINIVTVVHRNVTRIGGFGSPQLGKKINDKGMSGRKERRGGQQKDR